MWEQQRLFDDKTISFCSICIFIFIILLRLYGITVQQGFSTIDECQCFYYINDCVTSLNFRRFWTVVSTANVYSNSIHWNCIEWLLVQGYHVSGLDLLWSLQGYFRFILHLLRNKLAQQSTNYQCTSPYDMCIYVIVNNSNCTNSILCTVGALYTGVAVILCARISRKWFDKLLAHWHGDMVVLNCNNSLVWCNWIA